MSYEPSMLGFQSLWSRQMAIRSERIDYTVYAPAYEPGKGCWDFRTATKARLAAKRLGAGARVRRNINAYRKMDRLGDWWVERVWEWTGKKFVNITHNKSKGAP